MAKFNVGDFIIGNAENTYAYTNQHALCVVLRNYSDHGSTFVGIVARAESTRSIGETYEVNPTDFDAITVEQYFTQFPTANLCTEHHLSYFASESGIAFDYNALCAYKAKASAPTPASTTTEPEEPWKTEVSKEQLAELHAEIMDLLTKYNYRPTKKAVDAILNEWLKNNYELIKLLKRHPNYNGRFQIVFDHDYERGIDKGLIQGFCSYMHGLKTLRNNVLEELYIPPFTYKECKEYNKKFENWYYLLTDSSYKMREINGMNRNDIVREWERWNAKVQAYDCQGTEISGHRYTRESAKRLEQIKDAFAFLHGYFQPTLTKDAADNLNYRCPELKVKAGQKTSRVANKVCTLCGLDKIDDYNKRFAEYSDAINPLKIKRHTILSCHPVDYLTMSFGNSWASCHTIDINNLRNSPRSYRGEYRSGTLSYMLDSTSLIMYTVDAKYEGNEYELQDKINRNMFHFGNGKLIQGRVYPQDNDGADSIYTVFREIAQQIISDCIENGVNAWLNVKGRSECGEVTASYGTHYKDYLHYTNCNVSYYNKVKDKTIMSIGHKPMCIKCGREHEYTDRLVCRTCR